jgi:hypothetical protein
MKAFSGSPTENARIVALKVALPGVLSLGEGGVVSIRMSLIGKEAAQVETIPSAHIKGALHSPKIIAFAGIGLPVFSW